jgi:hypothetical protein
MKARGIFGLQLKMVRPGLNPAKDDFDFLIAFEFLLLLIVIFFTTADSKLCMPIFLADWFGNIKKI